MVELYSLKEVKIEMLWFKILCVTLLSTRALANLVIHVREDETLKDIISSLLAFGVDVFLVLGILLWL